MPAGPLARFVSFVVLKSFQYFWSTVTVLGCGWRFLRVGRALWHAKEHTMPRRLLDDYTHKHVQLPSGIKIHYVEAGRKESPLMICVHGYPEFWYSWRFQLAHFKDRYRVIAIDQRGYGDSDAPPAIEDYHIDKLARDVDEIIHTLGYEKAVVLGHDWGGAVVWKHALTYPQSVERLIVLNCPHPAAFQKLLKSDRRQMMNSWYMFMYQTPYLPEFVASAEDYKMIEAAFWGRKGGLTNKKNFTAEDMEAWKATFSRPGALTPPINYYRCSMQHPVGGSQKMCEPKTLVVWGNGDPFLLVDGAEMSKEWCRDGEIAIVQGASHWVQQDEPEIVNGHIDRFLADIEPNKSHL